MLDGHQIDQNSRLPQGYQYYPYSGRSIHQPNIQPFMHEDCRLSRDNCLVIKEVFSYHWFSKGRPQFISIFMKHLLKLLKISWNLSSSCNPLINIEMNYINQKIYFLHHQHPQNDQVCFLHMAKFVLYRDSLHSFVRYCLFIANIVLCA